MVVILYADSCRDIAVEIASDISARFHAHVEVATMSASSPSSWPADAAWDDLLIVVFDSGRFPDAGNDFIAEYAERAKESVMILPLAVDPTHKMPPEAAGAIKAMELSDSARGQAGRLLNRVGGMLGLRAQSRESQIFISYRALDGRAIADQLYAHLTSLGYRAWMDEAKEYDGETKILPGSPVQKQIDEGLRGANIVLLVDTPLAPHSVWIKHEVDTANALLLPVLPLCFRAMGDRKQGPRFRSLLDLGRWVTLENPDSGNEAPLTGDQLDQIVSELELYLCDIFRRKCRVPFLVQKEFTSRNFAWNVLDQRLLMFQCVKQHSWRLTTKVLSHCSIFDQVHSPALARFAQYLKECDRCNHSLFIYDGELMPEPQLREIAEVQEEPLIILHHQEVAALIDSNFISLVA